MIKLNDYLYSGNTVLKILKNYCDDLKQSALESGNQVDMIHSNFLLQITELLTHNDFLTSQSQRLREFYKYMASHYSFLSFTFKGRIKSVIRAEEKFNAIVANYISDYYIEHGTVPALQDLQSIVVGFHDLIAYRIVISLPRCHLKEGEVAEERELEYIYQVAEKLPSFLEAQGFTPQPVPMYLKDRKISKVLSDAVSPYYKDYISNGKAFGYKSLHISLYDNLSRSHLEVQLRTKTMDDNAEIGAANHLGYEQRQDAERRRREMIPPGTSIYFDEAYERGAALQNLDLSKLDVNMFAAVDNSLINDGCGLFRGRQILPYEHLSRFQNDLVG